MIPTRRTAYTLCLLAAAFWPQQTFAQYHTFTPTDPAVEIDLSVLDDLARQPVDPRTYDSVPLPPLVQQEPLESHLQAVAEEQQRRSEAPSAPLPPAEPSAPRVLRPKRLLKPDYRVSQEAPPPAAPPVVSAPPPRSPDTPPVVSMPAPAPKPPEAATQEMPAVDVTEAVNAAPEESVVEEAETAEPAITPQEQAAEPPRIPAAEAPPVADSVPAAPVESVMAEEMLPLETPEAPAEEAAPPAVPSLEDLSILFTGQSSDLDDAAKEKLKNIAREMKESGSDGRVQVRAYANGEDGSKASARRISLSRALIIRSFLMDNGIKPNRVDVRALGPETDRTPVDRADITFARD